MENIKIIGTRSVAIEIAAAIRNPAKGIHAQAVGDDLRYIAPRKIFQEVSDQVEHQIGARLQHQQRG